MFLFVELVVDVEGVLRALPPDSSTEITEESIRTRV